MASSDIEISSMSYTSRDFASLYPEVLDLAKKLTDKWDPSMSNESDPGVVLLKEAAFIADHNNYNIDKNILENFLPSATQDKSVRNICEMNGYTPRYYVSATGEVVLHWEVPGDDSEPAQSFTIPAFTLVISNEDESVSYTQAEDIQVVVGQTSTDSIQAVGKFIEGTLQNLSINDSATITIDNLDDNQRVYLPEVMVAQNGIYIRNVNQDDHDGFWERDNYLLTQPSGSYKYKVDFDSDYGIPYIEFPSDISNLIGDGLVIQYISTSGSAGNVKATELSKIVTPTTFVDSAGITRSTDYFKVSNARSFTNGKDPETIVEMYNSFKKVVGTFDTLITCKDYSDFIYEMEDDNGDYLVSNGYVTDRRTDYNKAANVVTFNNEGTHFTNISLSKCALRFKGVYDSISSTLLESPDRGDIVAISGSAEGDGKLYVAMGTTSNSWVQTDVINLNDFSLLAESMTPYDLIIYALRNYMESEYNSLRIYRSQALENSFKPASISTREMIEANLEDTSCICHTFKDPSDGEVYIFKNYEPLKIVITPYVKIIDEAIGDDIVNNVIRAISENFNPRFLEFGKDINTADVKRVLISCDPRIKDIDITPTSNTGIEEYTYAMDRNGSNSKINDTLLLDMISKNVLAGRVCMFEMQDSFKVEYGQMDGRITPADDSPDNKIKTLETRIPLKVYETIKGTSASGNYKFTEYRMNPSKLNLGYIFYAPNFSVGDTLRNVTKDVEGSLNYIVDNKNKKIADTLTIYTDDGKVKTVFKSNDSTKYAIRFENFDETDSPTLVNADAKEINYDLSSLDCDLVVEERATIYETDESDANLNWELRENEHIQIIYPNYYSDKTYSMYVNYRFISANNNKIPANAEYTLDDGDILVLNYTDEGVEKSDSYYPGDIINASMDITPTDNSKASAVLKSWVDINGIRHEDDRFKSLASNQTISTRKQMSTIVNGTNVKCYWIMDNDTNTIKWEDGDSTKILKDNEYFIYANQTLTEMVILGAGTRLICKNTGQDWSISSSSITIKSITENGLASNIPWKSVSFNDYPLTIDEMAVITLSEGNSITISGWEQDPNKAHYIKDLDDNDVWVVDGRWQNCDATIKYTISGSTTVLPKVNKDFYFIRSSLDFMATPTSPQTLLYTTSKVDTDEEQPFNNQQVLVNGGSDNGGVTIYSSSKTGSRSIYSNMELNSLGGVINIPDGLMLYDYVRGTGTYSKAMRVSTGCSSPLDINRTIPLNEYPFFYSDLIKTPTGKYLIPIYVSNNEKNVYVSIFTEEGGQGNQITLEEYPTGNQDTMITISEPGLHFIRPLPDEDGELYMVIWWGDVDTGFVYTEGSLVEDEIIVVDDLKITRGINKKISTKSSITEEAIVSKINELISKSDKPSTVPYYVYEPDNDSSINLEKYCNYTISDGKKKLVTGAFDSQFVMWDVNNVANLMVLPFIDIDTSDININYTMRTY